MTRRRPGERLRGLASRFCSDAAMARLIDPALADLQSEYADAVRRGQSGRRRFVRVAGTLAFWKVISVHAAARAVPNAREWAAADDHAARRTIAFAIRSIAVTSLLFGYYPLSYFIKRDHLGYYATVTGHDLARLALYLLPSALAVSSPLGFAGGVLFALRGRTPTRRVRHAVLAIATVYSVLVLIAVAWVVPESNHAFGQLAFGRRIPRGTYEMTLSELWATGRWLDVHQRLALSFGPAILGLFAFSVCAVVKNRSRALVLGLAGLLAYATQYWGPPAPAPAVAQSVSAILAAWTPNLIFAAATAAILKSSHS